MYSHPLAWSEDGKTIKWTSVRRGSTLPLPRYDLVISQRPQCKTATPVIEILIPYYNSSTSGENDTFGDYHPETKVKHQGLVTGEF